MDIIADLFIFLATIGPFPISFWIFAVWRKVKRGFELVGGVEMKTKVETEVSAKVRKREYPRSKRASWK